MFLGCHLGSSFGRCIGVEGGTELFHGTGAIGAATDAWGVSHHVSPRSFAGIRKEDGELRKEDGDALSLQHLCNPIPWDGKSCLAMILGQQKYWEGCAGRDSFKELLFPAWQEEGCQGQHKELTASAYSASLL